MAQSSKRSPEPEHLIYLSGPMSGYPDYNRPTFHKATAQLRKMGYDVVSPAEGEDEEGVLENYTDYYRKDLTLLKYASAICLLPGWRQSRGARWEAYTMGRLLQCPAWEYDPDTQEITLLSPFDLPDVVFVPREELP